MLSKTKFGPHFTPYIDPPYVKLMYITSQDSQPNDVISHDFKGKHYLLVNEK